MSDAIVNAKGDHDKGYTVDEVLALPVTVDLMTTARALGISRATAYELAKRGRYPIKLARYGQRYRATRADLLRALGIEDARPNG